MELTALAVGEPNAGAVLQAAMAVTAFGPGGDGPGDVDDDVKLILLPQRPMVFRGSEEGMQDRMGVLETAVADAVDHGNPPACPKMLRDIVFRTKLDAFRRAFLDEPPACVKPMTVQLQPCARAVRAKPRASPPAKAAWLHGHMCHLETARMVFRNPQAIYGSVAMAIPKDFNSYRMLTDYRAFNGNIKQAVMSTSTWKTKRFCSWVQPHARGAVAEAARGVPVKHTAHQAPGGAPCHRQRRVDGRACGRVRCCATTGERSDASESPKAKVLRDDVPTAKLEGSVAIADMFQMPLGFPSGPF